MAFSPGPIERRWTSRVQFKLTGRWPRAVADERMARASSQWDRSNVEAIMRDVYAQAGQEWPGWHDGR